MLLLGRVEGPAGASASAWGQPDGHARSAVCLFVCPGSSRHQAEQRQRRKQD